MRCRPARWGALHLPWLPFVAVARNLFVPAMFVQAQRMSNHLAVTPSSPTGYGVLCSSRAQSPNPLEPLQNADTSFTHGCSQRVSSSVHLHNQHHPLLGNETLGLNTPQRQHLYCACCAAQLCSARLPCTGTARRYLTWHVVLQQSGGRGEQVIGHDAPPGTLL